MGMKITKENILKYAQKYDKDYKQKSKKTEDRIKSLLKNQRYLTRQNLITIGDWKAPRARRHYSSSQNSNDRVKQISQFSFGTRDEKTRMESLLGRKGGLRGVYYPTASTILHFAFPEKYPIVDFRVLHSLWGLKPPIRYDFKLWEKYYNKIRTLAKKYRLPIRTVDKALWKYDELNSGRRKTCGQKK